MKLLYFTFVYPHYFIIWHWSVR